MSDLPPPFSHVVEQRDLPPKTAKRVLLEPDEATRAALAKALDLKAIPKLIVDLMIKPVGDGVWAVDGSVAAKVTQSCVVTLAPVKAKVDEPINRLFSATAEGDLELDIDIDVEEDDPPDPIGDGVDLGAIAAEALSLALEPYPRVPGAEFETVRAAPPGITPMTPEETKPFAGLAALKKSLEDSGESSD